MRDLETKINSCYRTKSNNKKIYKKDDEIIFPLFFRTLKETSMKLFHKFNIDDVIKYCISSRVSHSSENYFDNISYWPKDANLANGTNFGLLFLSRVFNLYFNKKPIDENVDALIDVSIIILDNLESYSYWSDGYYADSQKQEILTALETIEAQTIGTAHNLKAKITLSRFKKDSEVIKNYNFINPTRILKHEIIL